MRRGQVRQRLYPVCDGLLPVGQVPEEVDGASMPVRGSGALGDHAYVKARKGSRIGGEKAGQAGTDDE